MSLHVRAPPPNAHASEDDSRSSSSASSVDENDECWDDWVSDSAIPQNQPCGSLFTPGKTLPTAAEAVDFDKQTHNFNLTAVCDQLGLDFHARIRLVNYIRKNTPSVGQVLAFTGKEDLFSADEWLVPVVEDDPLLQIIQSEDWSDDEETNEVTDPEKKIKILEKKLARAQQDLVDYRSFVGERLSVSRLSAVAAAAADEDDTPATLPTRDDDSHYFESYGQNDIHAVMIQDKVRTSTYASFILKNPDLFRDAIVLDVGCGTGILSLFAARGGAKRVFAVDASDIALKAREIVKANNLENVITVIQGKIEEITLPDNITHVDIIVSEWMGYALLYESMLDSVLVARDRFLRTDGKGVMAPSQTQMVLGMCDASEIIKDRVSFWDDVYGFDLSTMAIELYEEAIVDVVGPHTMLSEPYVVKDLYLPQTTPRSLDFSSPFTLTCTADRRTKLTSLILYFDTFFSVTGDRLVSPEVKVVKEEDMALAEVWPVGGKPPPMRRASSGWKAGSPTSPTVGRESNGVTSFSTGPKSVPTHWKQTLFLLREVVWVEEGTTLSGTFHCRKSPTNSRELEVELHYSVKKAGEEASGDMIVQMYKVR